MKTTPYFLVLVHLLLLITLQFTAWPEMLAFPYLKNNGFNLYRDMVHPYPPLLTITLATLYKYLGTSIGVLKIFTWSLIMLSDILVFKITKVLTKDSKVALFSLAVYVLTQPFLEGNMLWFDTALTAPLLASLYALLVALNNRKVSMQALALSGYFVTLAISIKQTAAIYFLVFFLYLYFKTRRLKSLLFFSSSILFIGTIFALKLYTEGNLEHFLNWTVIYPSKYWTSFPGYVQLMPSPKQLVILGLLLVPTAPLAWQSIKNRQKTLILGLVFGATIAIYPRFSLFHLQPGVALMAVSTAWALSYYKDHFEHYAITYCLLVFALISLPVLQSNLGRETRFIGKSEYLSAQKIKESIGESKTLYLLGPHSAFYVFTDTLPPKPWIDNFGWYWEVPGVADDALVTWSGNPPDAIVIKTPEEGAWHDLGTYQPEILQQWIQDNYLKAKQLDPDTSLWTRIN